MEKEKKVILVKKKTNNKPRRFCLNCGVDISHLRSNAKFCSPVCWQAYNGKRTKSEFYTDCRAGMTGDYYD